MCYVYFTLLSIWLCFGLLLFLFWKAERHHGTQRAQTSWVAQWSLPDWNDLKCRCLGCLPGFRSECKPSDSVLNFPLRRKHPRLINAPPLNVERAKADIWNHDMGHRFEMHSWYVFDMNTFISSDPKIELAFKQVLSFLLTIPGDLWMYLNVAVCKCV